MIDLHLHTYYSDGTLSPKALVLRAAERGVKKIAITDHDGFDAIPEALSAGRKYGIEVIPGIEFSAGMEVYGNQVFMHILGYNIDIYNKDINEAVVEIRKKRNERNEKILQALGQIGYSLKKKDLLDRPGQDFIGKPNFALAMVKKGYINSPQEAFTKGKYLKHPNIKKIHRQKIHTKKAISLINNAGGEAVLAHPFKIAILNKREQDFYQELEKLLDILQQWGLSGMECYYSKHTNEQAEKLSSIAMKRGLKVTSGSDFHGPEFDPLLDIGVVVPE